MSAKTKGLTLFALTMIAIGSTIGSGIFKTPTDIANAAPDASLMIGLWVIGGLISLVGALVFAELGARIPKGGGVYSYLHEIYGPLPAFLYGWCLLVVVSSGTIAALIVVFADYLQYFVGFDPELKPIIAAASIVVLTLFNTFGIKSSEWFANISTVLKIVGIYGLLIIALFLGKREIFEAAPVVDLATGKAPEFKYAVAFVGVFWSYTGWHYASFVSADAINPRRNVPLAMILGTAAVTVTYVLCNMAYLKALPMETIQTSDALAATAMDQVIAGGGSAVAVLIALSVFGCAGLYILATPRIIQQMSLEGIFPKVFADSHPRFGVPLNAILLQSVWAIVLVFFWGKFEALYTYVTITEWLFLLAACAGIFVVRYRLKKSGASVKHDGFVTPLYPILPIIFCVFVLWFISENVVSQNSAAYFGLLIIPIGAILYYVLHYFKKKQN